MDLKPWDPWREFDRVREEADRVFAQFFAKVQKLHAARPITFFPTTDAIETGEDLRYFFSLPGVVEEDIDIAVEDRVLVVRGEREPPYDAERVEARVSEWRYGYFERRLDLPAEAEPDALSATFRWGVLTVVIPKRKAPEA